MWETRGNKRKSKARKGQKQNGKGKEEQPSIVPGCKTVVKNNNNNERVKYSQTLHTLGALQQTA